jgi:hypothetical protein
MEKVIAAWCDVERQTTVTATANAGSFDKLRTGSSTTQFAKYANGFAQDDNVFGLCG